MDKTPVEPSLAVSDAVTRTPLEIPGLPPQPDQYSVDQAFHSSSLPHLGDFMAKLLDDAYKLQSLNVEFERTKLLLREAEDKLASFEEPKSSLRTQLSKAKNQLRKAEAKIASTEKALRREKKRNEGLEANNIWLNVSLSNHQDLLYGAESLRVEAENKLQAAESRANILENDLRKKNDALEQKDEAFQMKIRGYRDRLQRLGSGFKQARPIVGQLYRCVFSLVKDGLTPRIYNGKDLLEELAVHSEITNSMNGEFTEFFWEFKRDLCQTRG